MKLKTYHSESVEAAVRLAGVELGDDAIFLGSREKPCEQGGAGYEVTFALMETPAVGAEVEPETRAAGQVPSPGTAVRPQGIATRPRATSHKDTRQAAAPPPSRSTAISAATAVGTTQANVSSSPGAVKRIELPHWKKYIPENLDANLERAPGQDQTSNGSNGQAHRPAASEPSAPENFTSAPAVADEPTLAAAASSPGPAAAVQLALTPDRPDPASSATRLDSYAEPAEPIPVAARLRSPSLAVLHDEILDIRRLLHRFLEDQPPLRPPSASQIGLLAGNSLLANQYGRLAQKGLDPMLIFRLISPLFPLAQTDRYEDLENEHESRLRAALESLCDTTAELGDQNAPARVCAFVGPSGAGKTSCVAKLAIQQGWQQGLRIHLISLDQHRLGAAEQLQAYARVAEIPITTVEDVSELGEVLDRLHAKGDTHGSKIMPPDSIFPDLVVPNLVVPDLVVPDLILIDTPSYAPLEPERAAAAAQALTARPSIDRHLVLSLSASHTDQQRALDRYRAFAPAKLLFTKLDDCSSPGGIFNQSVSAQLPVSFISTGPVVPEDIRPASPAYLAELMLQT